MTSTYDNPDHATDATSWWSVEIESSNPDEAGYRAVEAGARGCEVLDERSVRVFFEGTEAQLGLLLERLAMDSMKVRSFAVVAEKNWVAMCDDLLQPIRIGRLLVSPFRSSDERPADAPAPDEIRLVPGLGFGTGHHPSTALALELMQDPLFGSTPPRTVLDVGTGSGVLSLAAARLYPRTRVVACDTDAEALRGARDNLALNGSPAAISLIEGGIERVDGVFDLLLANIYAEVLVALESRFAERVAAGGALVLSGILEERAFAVKSSYSQRWSFVRSAERDGWSAYLCARK